MIYIYPNIVEPLRAKTYIEMRLGFKDCDLLNGWNNLSNLHPVRIIRAIIKRQLRKNLENSHDLRLS
jgi:hypothetical protein